MDEAERFQQAIHQMRDAFVELRDRINNVIYYGAAKHENGDFFDGYAAAKRVFGDVLLQRDVKTAITVEAPPAWAYAAQHTYTPACDGFHEPGQCPGTRHDE